MPDAWWNTTTGPPGPTLLYDPPFMLTFATDRDYISAYDNRTLTWAATPGGDGSDTGGYPPLVNGTPFVSVSGTDVTFLCDCTVVVSIGPSFLVSDITDGGSALYTLGGTTYDTSPYLFNSRSQHSFEWAYLDSNRFMNPVWTTPPFKALKDTYLQVYQTLALSGGTLRMKSTELSITRVA